PREGRAPRMDLAAPDDAPGREVPGPQRAGLLVVLEIELALGEDPPVGRRPVPRTPLAVGKAAGPLPVLRPFLDGPPVLGPGPDEPERTGGVQPAPVRHPTPDRRGPEAHPPLVAGHGEGPVPFAPQPVQR